MFKRTLSLLSLLLLVTILAACGSAPATGTPAASSAGAADASAAPSVAAEASTVADASTEPDASASAEASAAAPEASVATTVLAGGEGCAPNAPKVTWYIGLGAGGDADVIPREEAWVDNFNKSQTDACLVMQVVHNPESYDTLKAQLAAGTGPDIVGPVGRAGRASFQGAWQDITPLAEKAGFDLTQYDPTLLDFVKDNDVQVGLPFALYPGVIFYNKTLFDEARLPYPPHKVGEQYQGKEWNLEALTELAKQLTVDANGNTPNDANFDPESITQFGFWQGFGDSRRILSWVNPELPFDPANPTTAKIPDSYRTEWRWYYDGIWNSRFMPNYDYTNSDAFAKGNPFSSGRTAMTWTLTWYTCCFDMAKLNWDMAVVPSINGKVTAGMDGDTFAILKSSKNQDAAFKVLVKMVQDKDLAEIYGGLPGKESDRPAFIEAMNARAGDNKVDWAVLEELTNYPDIPGHEAWMPNMIKATDAFNKFKTLMDQTPGLNIDQEIDKFQAELDTIFKEPGAVAPSQ